MADEYDYRADDTATGAVNNNALWLKVKLKNTIRYVALATVIIAFYHFFAPWVGLPAWGLYIETISPLWNQLPEATWNFTGNIFIGAAAACVVWFMP